MTIPLTSDALALRPHSQLDRQVLVLTATLWLTHFLFMVSKDLPAGLYSDWGTTFARLITSVAATLITLVLYFFVQRTAQGGTIVAFGRVVLMSIPACAATTLINELAFSYFSANYLAHPELFLDRGELIFTFSFFSWIFVAWAALYTMLRNSQHIHEQEHRIVTANSAANAAQLRALQLQIHPHFLFNTLNTLSGLVGLGRTADAERTILNLSAFLRHTLSMPPDHFVRLDEELDVQRMYLEIESVRFADRLIVKWSISNDCGQALVPALIIQPLVDNAIKHALAPSEIPVVVIIGARRNGETLSLWVKDERQGANESGIPGLGIGLANVAERLEVLFGERARLSAGAHGSGWTAEISMPWLVRP